MTSALAATGFPGLLRHWRRTRGISQLALADLAGMSTRHLSFLETGRCGPSRGTVLQLGRALDLPRSETQRLLLVAGYACEWTRRSVDGAGVRRQLEGIAHLLAAHDPFPAVISDPQWQVACQNDGARAFFERLRELSSSLRSDPVDLRQILADEHGFGRLVENRDELLGGVLAGLYQLEPDPAAAGDTRALMDVLPRTEQPGDAIARAGTGSAWEHPLRVRDGDTRFSLEVFSLPFAGPASGFALVLVRPAEAASRRAAQAYFARLVARSHAGV